MAAFGEKVPAKPPLSFQAINWPAPNSPPLMNSPTSWLTPGVAVHKSAFALIRYCASEAGVTGRLTPGAARGIQRRSGVLLLRHQSPTPDHLPLPPRRPPTN